MHMDHTGRTKGPHIIVQCNELTMPKGPTVPEQVAKSEAYCIIVLIAIDLSTVICNNTVMPM